MPRGDEQPLNEPPPWQPSCAATGPHPTSLMYIHVHAGGRVLIAGYISLTFLFTGWMSRSVSSFMVLFLLVLLTNKVHFFYLFALKDFWSYDSNPRQVFKNALQSQCTNEGVRFFTVLYFPNTSPVSTKLSNVRHRLNIYS